MLYIASPADRPHGESDLPGLTVCGKNLAGMEPISESQALVFLGDARCHGCFPGHAQSRSTAGKEKPRG
jgi:hypothetical protein